MQGNDPRLRLRHMLDHAREAIALLGARSRQSFLGDRTLVLAMTRLVEVIGEAASQVPNEFREQHARIPWRAMVGMRHILIHAYGDVDYGRVWETAIEDLPALIADLEAILDAGPEDTE